jgi:calcineurin-like phosphoesterase family protein
MTTWFSSDLHLGHDKDFIYEPRGFISAQENAETILDNFNYILRPGDDLYLLGDLLVGPDSDDYLEYLASFPCNLHLLWGNHDTDRRKEMFKTLPNLVETLGCGAMIKLGKWHFLLSHYPTLTANYDDYDKPLKERIWNLHGHTHSKNCFEFMDKGWQSYNIAVDAHNCYPRCLDEILEDIRWYYLQRKHEKSYDEWIY